MGETTLSSILPDDIYEYVSKEELNPIEDGLRLYYLRKGAGKNLAEEGKMMINQCYHDIIEFMDSWIDIPQDYKKIITIWIIGTYFHKEFDTYPYLNFNAIKGSGKTRALRIISWLQKNGNGEVMTRPSDPVMFRTAKERGLILDEFESEKSKDMQSTREYLNACYKKGGVVYRMEKQRVDNKEQQVAVGHQLYTPVALANINGIEDVLGDRSITLILEKSMNPLLVKKIEDFGRNSKIKEIKANLEKFSCRVCSVYPLQNVIDNWNSFVNDKYTTSLHTTHTIHNPTQPNIVLDELFNKIDKTGIFGRNLELFFPLLLTANLINSEFDEILRIVSALNMDKKDEELNDNKDVCLIEFISLAERHRFTYVAVGKLLEEFKTYIGWTYDDEHSWCNSTWFGSSLKRLKLAVKKRESKGVLYLLNIDHAKDRLRIFKTEVKNE